jgi:hypothetical protein
MQGGISVANKCYQHKLRFEGNEPAAQKIQSGAPFYYIDLSYDSVLWLDKEALLTLHDAINSIIKDYNLREKKES